MSRHLDNCEDEFREFVEHYIHTLKEMARRRASARGVDSAEVLSRGMERAWRAWDDILVDRSDSGRLAWCSITMYNVTRELSRMRLDIPVGEPPDRPAAGCGTPERAYYRMILAAINEVLDTLSEIERDVFNLAWDGFTMAEIGGAVGRSRQTISQLLARARARLTEELRRRGFDLDFEGGES